MSAFPSRLPVVSEADRLASLYAYDILQASQEGVFDQLVALSARLFNVPSSYVLLLDAEQGHYHATYGLPRLPPLPRPDLLCAQVVRQDQVVIYHDLATDAHAPADAAAVAYSLALPARFYAGAPLRMPDQCTIGTLCLIGPQPRSFSAREQVALEELAALVSLTIAVRHQCLHTPALGQVHWQALGTEVRNEIHQLGMLVRYLLTRYTYLVPVPDEVLHHVSRRAADLRELLTDRV